jgi:hypothetical protein
MVPESVGKRSVLRMAKEGKPVIDPLLARRAGLYFGAATLTYSAICAQVANHTPGFDCM